MEEKATENNQDQADGCDESNASQVGAIGSTVWTKHEIRCGNYNIFTLMYHSNTALISKHKLLSLCIYKTRILI